MKNYGHTWQWGKNPEYIIDVCTHWDCWALPLSISWWIGEDAINNKFYTFTINFLCFCFNLEIWRWKK